MEIEKKIDEIYTWVIKIRRHLHMYPELSEMENATMAYICDILDTCHISYRSGIAGNGIIALVGNSAGSCIGIRADIDALPVTEATGLPWMSKNPGCMHACGHDMHTAIALGVARILKDVESDLPGCVKFFFQPAEETIGGAKQMIDAGALDNPKVLCMLGFHVDPNYETGSICLKYGAMNAACEEFSINVKGKSGHGAHPENGIDAIVVAAQIITALQTISSRFTAPTTPTVVSIGEIHGGNQSNILCGNVTLTGTVRALSMETLRLIKSHVNEIACGTAKAFGAESEVCWAEGTYPPLINDDNLTSLLEKSAGTILEKSKIHVMEEPSLGADDFAFFSEAVPSTYFNLGVTAPGEVSFPLHNEHFSPNELSMKTAILTIINAIFTILKETQDEHKK